MTKQYPVLVVDITSVVYVTKMDSETGPVTVRGADGRTLAHSSASMTPQTHRQVLLSALDEASSGGVLTTTPMVEGRHSVPVYWYVPGRRTMKLGPSHSDAPVWKFEHGIVMDQCGYIHAMADLEKNQLTFPDGSVAVANIPEISMMEVARTLAVYRTA